MYRLLVIIWLSLPLGVVLWHFGPGQTLFSADRAGIHIRQARQAVRQERWPDAAAAYWRASDQLPEQAKRQRWRLQLAAAQATIRGGDLMNGRQQLADLLAEMDKSSEVDNDLQTSVRHELAVADYHIAWLLRLEDADEDQWRAAVTRSQEQFRLLAERAVARAANQEDRRNTEAHRQARIFKKNLEAAVKLERIALLELRSRPLPEDCAKAVDADLPSGMPLEAREK